MEELRRIGEVLGSLKTLMAFQDDIAINRRQCFLLADALNLTFEVVSEEIRENLSFDERELHRICMEAEHYVRHCMEGRDWWASVIVSLGHTADCAELHLHNLLSCLPVVVEAVEAAGEIAGGDQKEIHRRRFIFSKRYEREWMEPSLFQRQFGRRRLVSPSFCAAMAAAGREDRWALLEAVAAKRGGGRLAELVEGSKEKLFPSSILVAAKDYQVRRRLGSGSHYKEVHWMGENFAVRHFFGDIAPLVPEILSLCSLAHPNVIPILCAFSDEERKECFLLMELMQKSLCSHIKELSGPRRRRPFALPAVVDVMLQIARGMEYLYSRGIPHGNLSPSAILVKGSSDGHLRVKVAGVGLSSVKNPKSGGGGGDRCIWLAPEVLLEEEEHGRKLPAGGSARYTEKADVYSFAMICFELLTGKKMSRNIRAGERPLFPFPSPKHLTGLTKKCWQADSSQRPSFSAICRVLRWVKRSLLLNPEAATATAAAADYLEMDAALARRFPGWVKPETIQIPFQMFAYKVMEREKERSSESGSEGASVCGDDNLSEELLSSTPSSLPLCSELGKAAPGKEEDRRASMGSSPPQLGPCAAMRTNSENQLQPIMASPGRRRSSGHASDSDIA
ncbi:unnamed protein product [Spirodela intermedia]|uniref:Protein kinase domain-containing protein n=1 Tax=Spirodela intermedia TaxID=51605 RepID=A0A7I8JN55_SPIIN|nr:unnamed protein product [Spirodela intermedia]CAA6671576.1 unnamed protein product [Spirodela intermedia]